MNYITRSIADIEERNKVALLDFNSPDADESLEDTSLLIDALRIAVARIEAEREGAIKRDDCDGMQSFDATLEAIEAALTRHPEAEVTPQRSDS